MTCDICRLRPAEHGPLCELCSGDPLGHLGDSVEALHRAIEYLTLPPAKRLWPDRDVTPQRGAP